MGPVSIGWIDISIVILYLVFIVWWGLRHGKSGDAGSYFLAGRSMPWWVVGLSLFAASISSTALIGQCGDAYDTGIAVFNYNLTGVVVMVLFATFLLPLYIKSRIFTIPEFLEKRFDKRSRYFFSAICIGRALCRRPHHQTPVPAGRPAAHHPDFRPAGRLLYHPGRTLVGHQCGADPGRDPDPGIHRPHGGLFRARRRRVSFRPAR